MAYSQPSGQRLHLAEIKIENFGCCENGEQDFSPKLNILDFTVSERADDLLKAIMYTMCDGGVMPPFPTLENFKGNQFDTQTNKVSFAVTVENVDLQVEGMGKEVTFKRVFCLVGEEPRLEKLFLVNDEEISEEMYNDQLKFSPSCVANPFVVVKRGWLHKLATIHGGFRLLLVKRLLGLDKLACPKDHLRASLRKEPDSLARETTDLHTKMLLQKANNCFIDARNNFKKIFDAIFPRPATGAKIYAELELAFSDGRAQGIETAESLDVKYSQNGIRLDPWHMNREQNSCVALAIILAFAWPDPLPFYIFEYIEEELNISDGGSPMQINLERLIHRLSQHTQVFLVKYNPAFMRGKS